MRIIIAVSVAAAYFATWVQHDEEYLELGAHCLANFIITPLLLPYSRQLLVLLPPATSWSREEYHALVSPALNAVSSFISTRAREEQQSVLDLRVRAPWCALVPASWRYVCDQSAECFSCVSTTDTHPGVEWCGVALCHVWWWWYLWLNKTKMMRAVVTVSCCFTTIYYIQEYTHPRVVVLVNKNITTQKEIS